MFNQPNHQTPSQILFDIHQLVLDLISGRQEIAYCKFLIKDCHERFWIYFNNQINYQFSISIEVFLYAYEQSCQTGYSQDSFMMSFDAELFLDVLYESKHEIETEIISWRKQEITNRQTLISYVESVISHYSRLLFVRVDLGYPKASQHLMDVADVNNHMKLLLKRISNGDTCFRDLQGYAWALEQGADKGYHCHLLLMYDGSKRQKDYYLADEVGKVWQRLTDKVGCHFNCHTADYKRRFADMGKLGVGMIHRNNPMEVENALNVANYLVNPEKDNQMLLAKLPNMRTFGKGIFKSKKRRGLN